MKFDAALLAGGRSTRMGRDKALLDWRGRPLWRVQLEKLAALRPRRLFIASRAEQGLASCGDPGAAGATGVEIEFVDDPPGEDCGPLGALTRCLRLASAPLLVLGVDMPAMSARFLRARLLAVAARGGALVRGAHGFEALAAVYPPAALPFFEAALRSGTLALQPLLDQLARAGLCAVTEMRPGDARFFANVNTPAEAARLLGFPNKGACA